MNECITRERALEILNDIGGCGAEPGSYMAGWDEAINAAYEAIQSEPAADVAPVIHSKWEICCDGYYPYCMNCKAEPPGREMTKYCPNCGAKMDGGNSNDG